MGENSKREDLVLYSHDVIPIFKSKTTPDAILTNWEITSPPLLNNKKLAVNEAGVAWHGFYKKGKWFYFSLPGYVFLDMHLITFKKIFSNIFKVSFAILPFGKAIVSIYLILAIIFLAVSKPFFTSSKTKRTPIRLSE